MADDTDFSFLRSLATPVTVSSSASPIAVENEYVSADQQSSVIDDDDGKLQKDSPRMVGQQQKSRTSESSKTPHGPAQHFHIGEDDRQNDVGVSGTGWTKVLQSASSSHDHKDTVFELYDNPQYNNVQEIAGRVMGNPHDDLLMDEVMSYPSVSLPKFGGKSKRETSTPRRPAQSPLFEKEKEVRRRQRTGQRQPAAQRRAALQLRGKRKSIANQCEEDRLPERAMRKERQRAHRWHKHLSTMTTSQKEDTPKTMMSLRGSS